MILNTSNQDYPNINHLSFLVLKLKSNKEFLLYSNYDKMKIRYESSRVGVCSLLKK